MASRTAVAISLLRRGRSQLFAVPLSKPIVAALKNEAEVHLLITADAGLTLQRLPSVERENYEFPQI